MAAYESTRGPGSLGIEIGSCEDTLCVTRVIPGGPGWLYGVKPRMAVLSVNGQSVINADTHVITEAVVREVEVVTPEGEVLHADMVPSPLAKSPMKFSLWTLAGMFGLLGATVILRRPDLHAARMFWVFAGFIAAALAVGPSASGPAPSWARIIQVVSIVGIGSSMFPFAFALIRDPTEPRRSLVVPIFVSVAPILIAFYGVSLLVEPSLYAVVRSMSFLYVSVSVVGGIGFLAIKGTRQPSRVGRVQVGLVLWGTVFGMLPFVALCLTPMALGREDLLPEHITILPIALMPAAFAFAILQYQLLGIRKLVHRGMVYGTVTVVLLILVVVGLTVVAPLTREAGGGDYEPLVLTALVVFGIVLFFPLRRGARWVVDNLIYRDVIDYQSLWSVVHDQFLSSDSIHEVATAMAERLAQTLHLESVLLFLGRDARRTQLIAQAGEHASGVLQHMYPQLEPHIVNSGDQEMVELRWESESLILVNLKSASRYLGYMLLGPKRAGEIFVEEEKRLVATTVPLLALAIDESQLSEELREMNKRLIKAEETERARIAADLHDGPLQKAMLLAGAGGNVIEDRESLSHQIILELREICSRLRPAILDDLGIVPALEWLLESVSKRTELTTRLSLHDVGEEERFGSDIELALFRVTQEATNNAVKYAKGTSLEVSLSKEGNSLVLQIEDNGVGFSFTDQGTKGLGLPGMRERVVQLNGDFDVCSVPDLGTTVIARIPLG